jgi:branched-chain amino acid transport system ATP-binding protein
MPLLSLDNLDVAYGPIKALHGVSLHIDRGEVVTLIGANGAGKTTLLRTISGLLRPTKGEVIWHGGSRPGSPPPSGSPAAGGPGLAYKSGNPGPLYGMDTAGTDVTRADPVPAAPPDGVTESISLRPLRPDQIVRVGISHVPEGRQVFAGLTVLENLKLGAYQRKDDIGPDLDRCFSLFPVLAERRNQRSGTLSGGEQQMLAIGRALMSRPTLLLLDEPSLGLAPLVVRKIFQIIRDINAAGTTVFLVEQNAHMALTVAHRAYVLQTGRVIKTDRAAALLDDPEVRAAYLGG